MNTNFVIFCSDSAWTIARTSAAKSELVQAANADSAITAIKQLGYQGEGVLLALPSQWCLSARVDTRGLPSRNRQSGLLFRLEEQLPLAIEEFVADFIADADHALGVAVAIEKLKPIVQLLEDHGIFVMSICPAAVLAAHQLNQGDLVLVGNIVYVDLITFDQGRISRWTFLPADSKMIAPHLVRATSDGAKSGIVIGIPDSLKEELAKLAGVQWIKEPDYPMNLAVQAAHRILTEGDLPPIELRQGALAAGDPLRAIGKPLIAATAAIILLGLSLAISLLVRAGQYDSLEQSALRDQQQAFHSALPQQTIPPAITSRLMSEQKRLSALSGYAPSTPRDVSILPLLQDVLSALPRTLRFRLIELRFEPNHLYLEGRALDHATADQIAQAIRQGTRLTVDPPHTQQQPGEDVNFTLTASMPDGAGDLGIIAQARENTP